MIAFPTVRARALAAAPDRNLPVVFAFGTLIALAALAAGVRWARGAEAPVTLAAADIPDAAEAVTVERVKPKRAKHPTLSFLKANRDFIRARYDLLHEEPAAKDEGAAPIDPRYLDYQRLLADATSARDSVSSTEEARRRQELLASITDLGKLESQLDQMDRLLADQRGRLGVLQADFTGHQRTALVVVASGWPANAAFDRLSVRLEDGSSFDIELGVEQRESLAKGGVVQVFHEFVEPREQFLEVALGAGPSPAGDSGYVTLEPARDRITMLRLDLSGVSPEQGAPSIRASVWLHDTTIPSTGS